MLLSEFFALVNESATVVVFDAYGYNEMARYDGLNSIPEGFNGFEVCLIQPRESNGFDVFLSASYDELKDVDVPERVNVWDVSMGYLFEADDDVSYWYDYLMDDYLTHIGASRAEYRRVWDKGLTLTADEVVTRYGCFGGYYHNKFVDAVEAYAENNGLFY